MQDVIPRNCMDCPIFTETIMRTCSAEELRSIDGVKDVQSYETNDYIFREGEEIKGLHCLYSGRVALTRNVAGAEITSAEAIPGDPLGVPGIMIGTTYINSAVALEPSRTCFVGREQILELLRKHPEIMLHAAQRLSVRIENLHRRLDDES